MSEDIRKAFERMSRESSSPNPTWLRSPDNNLPPDYSPAPDPVTAHGSKPYAASTTTSPSPLNQYPDSTTFLQIISVVIRQDYAANTGPDGITAIGKPPPRQATSFNEWNIGNLPFSQQINTSLQGTIVAPTAGTGFAPSISG